MTHALSKLMYWREIFFWVKKRKNSRNLEDSSWCDFHTWNAFSWKELNFNEFIRIQHFKWTTVIHCKHVHLSSITGKIFFQNIGVVWLHCVTVTRSQQMALRPKVLCWQVVALEFEFLYLGIKKSLTLMFWFEKIKGWFWNVRKFETYPSDTWKSTIYLTEFFRTLFWIVKR